MMALRIIPVRMTALLLAIGITATGTAARSDQAAWSPSDHPTGLHAKTAKSRQIAGSRLPSVVPGLGTFAGSLLAMRIRGNGLYLLREAGAVAARPAPANPPSARIIEISSDTGRDAFLPKAACTIEAGVCVIRGGR
ncbi:hypothetical protein [Rhizobium straminoryzae]|uniref:Uncharacterized protein n=1 Tax=Rhizobium straminoryzae TaxID=1387186 RepID=A0A549STX7_9HYPH|nr:hypothetical protein [Rhizobium straminoryzae]TRL32998.1 hypothetical protein FNA46_23110 [Rhizobium straminoryzae]